MNLLLLHATRWAALLALPATLVACSGDAEKKAPSEPVISNSPMTTEARRSPAAAAHSRNRIDSLEAAIRQAIKSPTKAPDIRLAMYTIQAYQYFAADFPKDPRAAEGLDRAGQLYAGVLGDYEKAAEYYEKAYQNYPDYKKRPQLLLQMGLAFEAGKDTANASTAYQRLISGYPQSPLAEQARGLLRVLRMNEGEKAKTFK